MNPAQVYSKINSKEILDLIYSFGAYDKKTLIQIINAKKIQRWYKKQESIDNYMQRQIQIGDWDSRSMYIRMLILTYTDSELYGYPEFSSRKLRFTPFWTPLHKRSEIRRWIMEHLNLNELAYVGY